MYICLCFVSLVGYAKSVLIGQNLYAILLFLVMGLCLWKCIDHIVVE